MPNLQQVAAPFAAELFQALQEWQMAWQEDELGVRPVSESPHFNTAIAKTDNLLRDITMLKGE